MISISAAIHIMNACANVTQVYVSQPAEPFVR